MAGKSNFILKNILMYSPQRDKALNISKKKVRIDGIGSDPNYKKINFKYKQCKPEVQIDFGKKVFNRIKLVKEIRYRK